MSRPAPGATALRILVYSDNPRTREAVRLALGTRLHPELPELSYLEVATEPMVHQHLAEGGFDLVILDGEATLSAGWASPNNSRTNSPTRRPSWC